MNNDTIKYENFLHEACEWASAVEKELVRQVENDLNRYGLMYRIFSRVKGQESVQKKLDRKKEKYIQEDEKMQDLIGLRIVLYFHDDIEVCIKLLKNKYIFDNCEHDQPDPETFKPQRINYVFRIPDGVLEFPEYIGENCRIDSTFEVQIRTIFSEGWHEVEHDIRYKYLDDWKQVNGLSRELNGVMAALEVCDGNILSICDKLAYRKYKEQSWEAMIRNKYRIRFMQQPLDDKIIKVLNNNLDVAKEIFRFDRTKLLNMLFELNIPKTYNNVVYVTNEIQIGNEELNKIIPSILKERCGQSGIVCGKC